MSELPLEYDLGISELSTCFKSVANSYKFYLFIAILDHLKEDKTLTLKIDQVALRMISLAWYPLVYYKLSFGRQDRFKSLAVLISERLQIDIRPGSKSLYLQIIQHSNSDPKDYLINEVTKTLKEYVIYRFIRPFFSAELKGLKDGIVDKKIRKYANDNIGRAPYSFDGDSIIIDLNWSIYFHNHQLILRSFIKWHLLQFLAKNNPNIIGLPNKIDKPGKRQLSEARTFWENYMKEETVLCLYSGEMVNSETLSLDHFIPWSYMVHDEMWNVIPTTHNVNSSKGDALPDLDKYLDRFCQLHYAAITFYTKRLQLSYLEDCYSIFTPSELDGISYSRFQAKIEIEFKNHIRIAKGLGFSRTFIYHNY